MYTLYDRMETYHIGDQRSPVSRQLWELEAVSSNLASPTEMVSTTQHSRTRKCKIGIQLNWLEHPSDTRKVESSILSIPTINQQGICKPHCINDKHRSKLMQYAELIKHPPSVTVAYQSPKLFVKVRILWWVQIGSLV